MDINNAIYSQPADDISRFRERSRCRRLWRTFDILTIDLVNLPALESFSLEHCQTEVPLLSMVKMLTTRTTDMESRAKLKFSSNFPRKNGIVRPSTSNNSRRTWSFRWTAAFQRFMINIIPSPPRAAFSRTGCGDPVGLQVVQRDYQFSNARSFHLLRRRPLNLLIDQRDRLITLARYLSNAIRSQVPSLKCQVFSFTSSAASEFSHSSKRSANHLGSLSFKCN
jgi:hypothetical protein